MTGGGEGRKKYQGVFRPFFRPRRWKMGGSSFFVPRTCVIEHKRCPTGKISQQQNQSQNRPVQNANTSHAAEACRLRASRRAEYASVDASGTRRKTRQFCAPGDAPVLRAGRRAGSARRETRRVSALERAECARRCSRGKRVGARGARASVRA